MSDTKSKVQELAEISGLSESDVQSRLNDGFVFYKPDAWLGGDEPGEWLDAKGTEYVVFGNFRWGRGNTIVAAKANFRAQGGLLKDGYCVVTFGEGSAFIGFGGMGYHWVGERPTTQNFAPK